MSTPVKPQLEPVLTGSAVHEPVLAVHPMVSTVYGQDFDQTDDLSLVFGQHSITELLAGTTTELEFSSKPIQDGGVQITVRSVTEGLKDTTLISHRLFFIDRMETRMRIHTISPDQPIAETQTLVLLPENAERDYFHVSVHDARDRLLTTQAVVFDRRGRSTRFPFRSSLVSDIRAVRADTRVVSDGSGGPRIRFSLTIEPQESAREGTVMWEAVGVIHRYPVRFEPGNTEVTVEVGIGADSPLCTGDWVLIAVDERERLISQSLWTLSSAHGLG